MRLFFEAGHHPDLDLAGPSATHQSDYSQFGLL